VCTAAAARLEVQHNVLDNESHCHACGSDSDQGLLLCCEACPFVYHTYCLRPPLEGVPAGAWYCPVCEGAEALLDEAGGLDRILAVRKAAASAAAAAAADEVEGQANKQQPQQQDEPANEFFVKWKERSYIHCAWISNEVMQRSAGIKHIGAANPVSVRLRKFWRGQAEAAANGDLREAEERGQLVNGINPAWMQVGRRLAQPYVSLEGTETLLCLYAISRSPLTLDIAQLHATETFDGVEGRQACRHVDMC
jgi:hypothetical protein